MSLLNDSMSLVHQRLDQLRADAALYASAGVDIPTSVDDGIARIDEFFAELHSTDRGYDRLTAAIRVGDIDELRAALAQNLAFSASGEADRAHQVLAAVPLIQELDDLLADLAHDALPAAAARYNAAAARLVDLAGLVDLSITTEDLVHGGASQKAQGAWLQSANVVRDLDDAFRIVLRVASRGGAYYTSLGPTVLPEREVAAAADVTDLDGDQVLDAWTSPDHRLGRWGALLALDAPLRALDTLDAWAALRDHGPFPQRAEWTTTTLPGTNPYLTGVRQFRHKVGTAPETGELVTH